MTDALTAPRASRSPWQLLYGAAHALRWRWWAGRARRLPRPVVSVGNLHWGGAGKTPLVAALGRHLRDRGLAVAVLSRGYPSRGSGVRLVSHGEGPLLGPRVAGDEPVMLAGELTGVAVVVVGRNEESVQAAQAAVRVSSAARPNRYTENAQTGSSATITSRMIRSTLAPLRTCGEALISSALTPMPRAEEASWLP